MTTAQKRARVLLATAAVVVAAVAAVSSISDGLGPVARSGSKQHGPAVRRLVRNAKPLWSGDIFKLARPNHSLPPYAYSSAAGPKSGWDQPHSNTDPTVQGVVVVDDPMGLRSTTDPKRGVRRVVKLTSDDRLSFDGYVRAQLRSPPMLGPGDDRWVIAEVFIPRDTPIIVSEPGTFWTILSVFGPPYEGASPDSFHLSRNTTGTGNDITWDLPDGDPLWRTPATPGVWHILARHIFMATDPKKGFSEVWYTRRGPDGRPLGPLTRQLVGGADGIPYSYRRHYATLDREHNWDGTPNSVNLVNYHTAHRWPHRRFVALYFARHRVYDGRTPIKQIDPYYTGLR